MERYALIGYPLGHTMSPFIHKKLFALSGRVGADYTTLEIPPEHLSEEIPMLLRQYRGFNVTIPHKINVIPFLSGLDETASRYGAVNVVKCGASSMGYNTDVIGFLRSIEMLGTSLGAGPVLVLGCGGVGRMMAAESLYQGAPSLTFAVREADLSAAEALKAELLLKQPGAKLSVTTLDRITGEYHLIINATPVGMYPRADACPVSAEDVQRGRFVFDAVYNPVETKLVRLARERGLPAMTGAAMLVWQAAAAQEIWNGVTFRTEDIAEIIRQTQDAVREQF